MISLLASFLTKQIKVKAECVIEKAFAITGAFKTMICHRLKSRLQAAAISHHTLSV